MSIMNIIDLHLHAIVCAEDLQHILIIIVLPEMLLLWLGDILMAESGLRNLIILGGDYIAQLINGGM